MSKLPKKRLGDIITLHRGYDLPATRRVEGFVPVISSSGITGTHSVAKLDGPNVITGRYGTIGEVIYHDGPCWPLNTTLYVSDFHDNNPRYVAYLLQFALNATYLDGTDKSTVPGVDRNVLHELSVPFVEDKAEQQRIVDTLSAIDDKVENNRKLMAELEATARLVYDEWFVRFDFPDEQGRPYRSSGGKMVWNDELKREIPAGWEVESLAHVLGIRKKGIAPKDMKGTIIEHYSIPAFDAGHYPAFDSPESIESNKYLVTSGDILYSKLNPKFKRLWDPLCLSQQPVCSTEFIVLVPKSTDVRGWCLSILDSEPFHVYMVARATSSTGSRSRVDPNAAIDYRLPLPPTALIKVYSKKVVPTQKSLKSLTCENYELASFRDWLLPMLMNGQVKVG